ncbi:T9SS type A sorting domain-containing protein [bacterium]|nr:T9SS type A sorting domain-containing protein [bacterium]
MNAVFNLVSEDLVPWNYNANVKPAAADIDADGDIDLLIADTGIYYYYENIGTSTQPIFNSPVLNWQGIDAPGLPMCFTDIDEDGDLDLFLSGPNYNDLWLYRNSGTLEVPVMQFETQHFLGEEVELMLPSGIDYVDIDNDGDGDFIFSGQRGGILFFRNTTGDTAAVQPRLSLDPLHGIQFSIGPNPANPITWISYNLPYPQKAEIAVYNLLGQKVATLASGLQMPGQKTLIWDAANYSSGVYWVRIATSGMSGEAPPTYGVRKIVVTK